jgi:hypothetical protein
MERNGLENVEKECIRQTGVVDLPVNSNVEVAGEISNLTGANSVAILILRDVNRDHLSLCFFNTGLSPNII